MRRVHGWVGAGRCVGEWASGAEPSLRDALCCALRLITRALPRAAAHSLAPPGGGPEPRRLQRHLVSQPLRAASAFPLPPALCPLPSAIREALLIAFSFVSPCPPCQVAGLSHADFIYTSFANAALGATPYIIALHR